MIGLRRLRLSGELLLEFFRPGCHGAYEVPYGLPRDARVMGVTHDLSTSFIWVTIASSEFDGPPEGGAIPELPPIVAHRCAAEVKELR